jgi:hypothetical protein
MLLAFIQGRWVVAPFQDGDELGLLPANGYDDVDTNFQVLDLADLITEGETKWRLLIDPGFIVPVRFICLCFYLCVLLLLMCVCFYFFADC